MNDDIEFKPLSVEAILNDIDYEVDPDYIPSDFALEFVNFIKLVEDGDPENKTPVVHYHMIDNFIDSGGLDTINLCHRGIAKSTLKEYLICYIGVYGDLPEFGKVPYALYVSDSMDNGVKKMRKSLEFRWKNSDFLQQVIPTIKMTDNRWEFINAEGNSFVVSGHGAKTGVRGTRENNSRPVLALLDDLISDSDARSATVIADVEDTIYKAIDYALHPKKRKIIWSGTPFNAKDPLYKAVESGAWKVNVYPVCEKFPCSRQEFRGSWEDRFDYDYVNRQYRKAKASGKVSTFNQELMLRIMSDEERLLLDSDISWFNRRSLLDNRGAFNFYITTDFATSDNVGTDFSVIYVWAYDHRGNWYLVDWVVKKQLMDKNIDDLFRLAQIYEPQQVGIEVSGQQKGFVAWVKREMLTRNVSFPLASENNSSQEGIRPVVDKMKRFLTVQPLFKLNQIHLPEDKQDDPAIIETLEELKLITYDGFKSKHDDCIDGISQLGSLTPWKPAAGMVNESRKAGSTGGGSNYFSSFDSISSGNNNTSSYIV